MIEVPKETHLTSRLLIVSNRLPLVVSNENGQLKIEPGSGGLITALAPILKNRGGIWIGWPGAIDKENLEEVSILLKNQSQSGFKLAPVFLSADEIKNYYEGFSNEVIWPLFHNLPSQCRFDPSYWGYAQQVSAKFAAEVKAQVKPQDFIWVHDYHLLLVGAELRKLRLPEKVGFFLHIPFPCPEIFIKLPWRFQVLRGLLEYDLVGFQTLRDLRNFIQCVKKLLPDVQFYGKGQRKRLYLDEREIRLGAFPVSIDFQEFAKAARQPEVMGQMWENLGKFREQKTIFSCDRLDISKGITYRLEAIRHLLKNHSDLHGKIVFFQIIIPSRTEITKYQELKKEIDRLVGEINSEFSTTGWVPIQYIYRSVSRNDLLALYRVAQIALITPVMDGMNLVAKEYIAANVSENGVLILSEFAGAAVQLQKEALLINPYDIEGLAETIYRGLTLSPDDIRTRMRKMRSNVQKYDIFWWLHNYLRTAIAKELHDFPIMEEFVPKENQE